MDARPFTQEDQRALAGRGIPVSEARRQLALMAAPVAWADLDRPCTPGDGLECLDDTRIEAALEAHAAASSAGRVGAFIPASGAATRMFKELLAAEAEPGPLDPDGVRADAARGSADARIVEAWVEGLPRFAFAPLLADVLARRGASLDALRERGPWRPLLEAFLDADGLGYADLPKALLAFHLEGSGTRTPIDEQLAEAAAWGRDSGGGCRLHFTVPPEQRTRFEGVIAQAQARLGPAVGATFDVELSHQHPATDTVAGDPAGGPFRGPTGELLFRPSGHGALLRNLAECGGDLVLLKNIDNVAVARCRAETVRWSRILLGLAARLSSRANTLLVRLDDEGDGAAVDDAMRFVREELREPDAPADRDGLIHRLARPLRVCGMVPNTGEPGGGPFWVRGPGGRVSRQIVEASQVDPASEVQTGILRRASHFNPVFLAVALRDRHRRPWDLDAWTDPAAVIVTRRSAFGRELLALERPGLWNGAMAGWNTVFVEVPLAVFNPVKTVLDLLRPEHQGAISASA